MARLPCARRGLKHAVKRGIEAAWLEISSLDAALSQVAREFDREDPLRPATRNDLTNALDDLKEAHVALQGIVGELDLPAVAEDEVQANLDFVRNFAEQNA